MWRNLNSFSSWPRVHGRRLGGVMMIDDFRGRMDGGGGHRRRHQRAMSFGGWVLSKLATEFFFLCFLNENSSITSQGPQSMFSWGWSLNKAAGIVLFPNRCPPTTTQDYLGISIQREGQEVGWDVKASGALGPLDGNSVGMQGEKSSLFFSLTASQFKLGIRLQTLRSMFIAGRHSGPRNFVLSVYFPGK